MRIPSAARVALASLALTTIASSPVSAITITSTVAQLTSPVQTLTQPSNPIGTYSFIGQEYLALTGIGSVAITLSLNDGDSAVGEFDFNNFVLELDGIDTGVALNGFSSGLLVTLTLTGIPPANAASILTALQADGILVGTFRDTDPFDQFLEPIPTGTQTALQISGPPTPGSVPEPASLTLLGVGIVALAFGGKRRKNRLRFRFTSRSLRCSLYGPLGISTFSERFCSGLRSS
jgi:hypothetical protein